MPGKIIIAILVFITIVLIILIGTFLEFIPTNTWKQTWKIIIIFLVFLCIVLSFLFLIVKSIS